MAVISLRPAPATPIDHLTKRGKLPPDALDRARRLAADSGDPIEPILTKLGLVSERDMADAFAQTLGLDIATLDDTQDEALIASISPLFLRQYQVLPLDRTAGILRLAMAYPPHTPPKLWPCSPAAPSAASPPPPPTSTPRSIASWQTHIRKTAHNPPPTPTSNA
jgi:hypothetical protein